MTDSRADRWRIAAANGLQNAGDQMVNAKTVLPWLFHQLGVPGLLIGLIVPIRESGSMLPQAALTPWIKRRPRRRAVWVAGAAAQALMCVAMAAAAALLDGVAAGVAILAALALFSLGRALCSISSKDVQGRIISKGSRGWVTGLSTTLGGIAAVTVGLAIRVFGGGELPESTLEILLASAGAAWLLGAWAFATVDEPAAEPEDQSAGEWARDTWRMIRGDRGFRRFIVVRSLLLVTALAPAFLVTLSAQSGASALSGLGSFILASGVAALLGGQVSGRLSDVSSRRTMIWGSGIGSAIILTALAVALWAPGAAGWALPAAYFLLALAHTGVRVARKTYVVDMASGDDRTDRVAVANTAMGGILLVTGLVSGALATLGAAWALLLLAVMGGAGVLAAAALPEVSDRAGEDG
ncbi:MFS transporter [Corynebacterium sp. 335C]